MIEKTEGLVLSAIDYGETSKILNVLTKEYGIIGVISKGCRRPKSTLCSASQKMTYGHFYIYYKKDKLSILKSVDLIDSFSQIRIDIKKISYAAYLLDLAEQVSRESKELAVFQETINSLIKINENYDPLVISLILKLRFLNFLGVAPVINHCALCHSDKKIQTLSLKRGGYICQNCYQDEKIYQPKTIKMIRMLYYVDISKISKININQAIKSEINEFLENYYQDYTGLYLKSTSFLEKIEQLEN